MSNFKNGTGKTTQIGFINDNKQICHGHRGVDGNDHNQKAYKMECKNCGAIYGANGSDVHLRKCPNCQNGAAGLQF